MRGRLAKLGGRTAGVALLWLLPQPVAGHDVPIDVTVQLFVHPEAERLRVLVRVPLEAMQEIRFPTYGPDLLDLAALRDSTALEDAAELWLAQNLELYADGRRLPDLEVMATRISLPSDDSFRSYERALAHITGEAPTEDTEIAWQQAMLDTLLEGAIADQGAQLEIRPRMARLGMRVISVLRFLPPGGGVRAFELRGDPGRVRLDPRWHHAARLFVEHGFYHILDGLDHLLFLACLVIPLRRLPQLILVVTSFTVAHSLTLISAAYGLVPDALWFPPLIELLIAASIVYMALENIVGAKVERRWMITFAFGLVHGFGFSFVLRETMQLAGSHLLTSLLAFNVGVELGQLFVLVLLVPLLDLLFRHVVAEKMGTIVLSALVAHTSWHWMSERAATLAQYPIAWPLLGAVPARVLPWVAPVVIVVVLGWRWLHRLRPPPRAVATERESHPPQDRSLKGAR